MFRKSLNFIVVVLLILVNIICLSNEAYTQPSNIKNDMFWNTQDGWPIYSQGGGIFKFNDPSTGESRYYWYGVHYKEAELYRENPSVTYPNCSFESVTCYSSTDLVHWTFEGDVLTKEELKKVDGDKRKWIGRMGVAYIQEANRYAMFIQHDKGVLVAVSSKPTGAFTWHQKINMEPYIGTPNTGDQTVFTDEETGKSYLVYCYGVGRNKIYISELGMKSGLIGLLDCTQVYKGSGREGNCMFKYKGKYYLCASNLYGWDASLAYYLVADNIKGPYIPKNDMCVMPGCERDYAHVTQTGFFYTYKLGTQETVIYCGDRWADFAGNGLGYNQWVPISFQDDVPLFNSISSWNFDAMSGRWEVASDNNYVMNASFEADRKLIPSNFKPVQQQLLGWSTTVIEGNSISKDSSSIILNYDNSQSDRKIVVGEKSLLITDKSNFKRKISQVIESTPYVPLKDGLYTLSASVKNGAGFSKLEMYAVSNGKKNNKDFFQEHDTWTVITMKNVLVKDGMVEIGFYAEGDANATCYIDDVSLILELE